jgi:hypothetical protein
VHDRVDGHAGAEEQAVDAEGSEGPGLEIADEEADGDDGRDRGAQGGDEGLGTDTVAQGSGDVGELEESGGQDDRSGQEEGEAGGVLVVETADEARRHADTVAAYAGDQGGGLGHAGWVAGRLAGRCHARPGPARATMTGGQTPIYALFSRFSGRFPIVPSLLPA